MKTILQTYKLLIPAILLLPSALLAQIKPFKGDTPAEKDFAGPLTFLSSDWMEGREAGARGGFMAADYIASMMQLYGLSPYGAPDNPTHGHSDNQDRHPGLQRYFQNFEVLQFKTEKATLALVRRTTESTSELQFTPGIDFEIKTMANGLDAEAPLVFAGYGISAPGLGYDDYKGLNVRDRIVVVLDGFPGHADTTSPSWKVFGNASADGIASLEKKAETAAGQGAVALVVVSAQGRFKPYSQSQHNLDVVQSALNSVQKSDPPYDDAEYALPQDTTNVSIPVIFPGASATNQLFSGTGIVPADVEKRIAGKLSTASASMKEKRLRISFEVKPKSLVVRNVLGVIRGQDTTRSIVVGAHYDHLGMRNGLIYHGADDNASGTSGMLALARWWSEQEEKPSCNIIFAAWTAEEKGLLGSTYFVQHTRANPEKILLAINMDMISRSAPGDTAGKILSIGTLPSGDRLKKVAGEKNLLLDHPFVLDLWDVTGHTGSDYGSFIALKIPVMTFFSGFHDDYHTPRDVASKVDFEKMENVLELVNECVKEFAGE